jgi:malonate-semialdehyde dehydrogenase (acetylating)/methylmalonate-semialdehyde dehydrogenase
MSVPAISVKRLSHWIGGKPVESVSGRSGVVWNPATGEQQASVDFASVEEVDFAVAAAKTAFQSWRATPLSRRAEVMFKLRELIDSNRRNIAEKITLEHGKSRAVWKMSSSPAAFPTC